MRNRHTFVRREWGRGTSPHPSLWRMRMQRPVRCCWWTWTNLPTPIPGPEGWFYGIRHENTRPENQGRLWPVVTALQSMKKRHNDILGDMIDLALEELDSREGEKPLHETPVHLRPSHWRDVTREDRLRFMDSFPETRKSHGLLALTHTGWRSLFDDVEVGLERKWVQHLLNLHNGEVRLVGDPRWEEVTVWHKHFWGAIPWHCQFWHDQTLRTYAARDWAWRTYGAGCKRSAEKERNLTRLEVEWILKEHKNETYLMKYCPASGGNPEKWFIKAGQYITLGELFVYGHLRCSCWDLYKTYTSLPIFIRSKYHSSSSSARAIFRGNAKRKRYSECGRWGLPSPSPARG